MSHPDPSVDKEVDERGSEEDGDWEDAPSHTLDPDQVQKLAEALLARGLQDPGGEEEGEEEIDDWEEEWEEVEEIPGGEQPGEGRGSEGAAGGVAGGASGSAEPAHGGTEEVRYVPDWSLGPKSGDTARDTKQKDHNPPVYVPDWSLGRSGDTALDPKEDEGKPRGYTPNWSLDRSTDVSVRHEGRALRPLSEQEKKHLLKTDVNGAKSSRSADQSIISAEKSTQNTAAPYIPDWSIDRNRSASHADPPVRDYKAWMGQLPQALHDRPLMWLAIPGSHDSFSYSLDKAGPIASSAPGIAKKMVERRFVKKIIYKWSVTQSLDVTQQLERGIRYFDFRTAPKGEEREPHFVHGFYGPRHEDVFKTMNEFLENEKSRQEILLLDFSHFYDMSGSDHKVLLGKIRAVFGSKVCPLLDMRELTLHKMWENGWQVIVFYNNSIAENAHDLYVSRKYLKSIWHNQQTPLDLVRCLEARYHKDTCRTGFYVSQGVLTPSGQTIVLNVKRTLRNVLCVPAAKPFVNWLSAKRIGTDKGLNICIMDFVELANFIPQVIELNHV